MTDPHASFLTAIIAAPDDDLPRLVYADFLDEHGDSERAEFIRVQCEAARLHWVDRTCPDLDDYGRSPPRWQLSTCQCRGCVLRRRERELLDLRQAEWVPAVIPDIGADAFGPVIAFRRGFVEAVTLSWANWNACADALLAATPLREVPLTTWPNTLYRVLNRRGATAGFRFAGRAKVHDAPDMLGCLAAEWPRLTFTLPGSPFPGQAPIPVIESRPA